MRPNLIAMEIKTSNQARAYQLLVLLPRRQEYTDKHCVYYQEYITPLDTLDIIERDVLDGGGGGGGGGGGVLRLLCASEPTACSQSNSNEDDVTARKMTHQKI